MFSTLYINLKHGHILHQIISLLLLETLIHIDAKAYLRKVTG